MINEAGNDNNDQFNRLYQILLARNPSDEEKVALGLTTGKRI